VGTEATMATRSDQASSTAMTAVPL